MTGAKRGPEPKSLLFRFLYATRNWRSRALFRALEAYCEGKVLDVGGWDFYLTAREKPARFQMWVTVEQAPERLMSVEDGRFRVVCGDGCNIPFADGSFDTVLSIQTLEHVLEPIRMVQEIGRVTRPDGSAIFLIPQTSTTHLAPRHYYNFSRFWIREVMDKAGLEVRELKPLGGIWSSMASHLFFFFLQSVRVKGMTDETCRRNAGFYVLYPVMILFALVSLPICLLLSLGDLSEEPNNHLVVARKRRTSTNCVTRAALAAE